MSIHSPRFDALSERLIEFVARSASGIKVDHNKLAVVAGHTLADKAASVVENLGKYIGIKSGNRLKCRLCGRGLFTKRGMYLHLIRMHRYDIKNLIMEEFERILEEP